MPIVKQIYRRFKTICFWNKWKFCDVKRMHWYSTFNPETYIIKTNTKKGFFRKETFFFPCVCAYKNATLLKYIIKKKKPHSAKFRIFWGSQTVQPTIKGWCTKFCWKSFTIFSVIAYVFGPFCKWPILPPKLDFHIILMASLALSPHTHFLYPFPLI